jgi:hypothetical protein
MWSTSSVDNAKAKLPTETLGALYEFVGCRIAAKPEYSPDAHPYIERFFGTIAAQLSPRYPGANLSGKMICSRRLVRSGCRYRSGATGQRAGMDATHES